MGIIKLKKGKNLYQKRTFNATKKYHICFPIFFYKNVNKEIKQLT